MHQQKCTLLHVKAHVHVRTCLQTQPHAHKVAPAASGRLNHALIKPWSEFELGHYPLTVINAAALLGGQSRQWGRDAHRTYRCRHKSSMTGDRIVYIICVDEVCIISTTRKLLRLFGEELDKWEKKSNPLTDTLLSNQSGKWWGPRYYNHALDTWWDKTKLLLKS